MSLGQTYFARIGHYSCNKNTRAYSKIADVNIYIPYADYSTRPLGTVRLMRYGLIDSGYAVFSAWMPDFSVVTCPAIFGYSSSIVYPKAHYNNLFPATHCTYMGSWADVINNLGDLWVNPANGKVLGHFMNESNCRLWDSLTSFANGDAGTTVAMVPFEAAPSNGSGSTAGTVKYLCYSRYNTADNRPEGFGTFTMQGALSTTNDINFGSMYVPSGAAIDSAMYDWLGTSILPVVPTANTDPYDNLPTPGDDPLPGGDSIPEPGFPTLSAASTGIVGLFCPSVAQMQLLADFMWTDFGGQGTTVIEVLEEVVEAIKRSISNPLDYIFGLNMIPSQGLTVGGSKVVKFGFVSSGVSMPILADHYFRVDCGSLSFDTLCGDSFLDYAPYSKFSIYLPYIGFKDLDPNDLVGHTISVVYHGDAITGGLTAYIFKDGNVMYQYSGGCALNIPLSSDNWGATIAAAASVATGVLSAAAVPGAAGVAGAGKALLKGAASNVASNPSLLSPQVMHSGAVTGSPGFMGVQYPFIIREAVNFHSTAGFNKSSGYPAYYYRKLGDVTGYTTVLDAHMANIPMATQEEIEEIENLLEGGVIL